MKDIPPDIEIAAWNAFVARVCSADLAEPLAAKYNTNNILTKLQAGFDKLIGEGNKYAIRHRDEASSTSHLRVSGPCRNPIYDSIYYLRDAAGPPPKGDKGIDELGLWQPSAKA